MLVKILIHNIQNLEKFLSRFVIKAGQDPVNKILLKLSALCNDWLSFFCTEQFGLTAVTFDRMTFQISVTDKLVYIDGN